MPEAPISITCIVERAKSQDLEDWEGDPLVFSSIMEGVMDAWVQLTSAEVLAATTRGAWQAMLTAWQVPTEGE